MKVNHYLSLALSLTTSFSLLSYPIYPVPDAPFIINQDWRNHVHIHADADVIIDFQVFAKFVLHALQTRDDKSPIFSIMEDIKNSTLKIKNDQGNWIESIHVTPEQLSSVMCYLIWPATVIKTTPYQYPVPLNQTTKNVVFLPNNTGVRVTFLELIANEPWILSRQEEVEFIGQVYGKEAALDYLKKYF